MLKMVYFECKKAIRFKQIILSFIGAVLFSSIIFLYYIGKEGVSIYTPPIAALGNLFQTFTIVIFLGSSAYLYGLEVQERTLKILYMKAIPEWKVILVKFITGIIFAFCLLYIVAALLLLVSALLYSNIDFMEYDGSSIISAKDGIKYVFLAYTFQGLSSIFIVSLGIALAIIFNSGIISLLLTFLIMIGSFLAGNIGSLRPFLPTTYWSIWQEIMKKDIVWNRVWVHVGILLCYSLLLYFIAVFCYKRKDIKV